MKQMMRDGHDMGWGEYAPTGMGRVLLFVRQLGFARGSAKKHLGKLWAKLALRTPVDIRYSGLKFRLHPFDNAVESKMLFGSKLRDQQELSQLRGSVHGGGVFLDIGANIGYYALMAASFGASRVLAFEPNPKVYARLCFNIAANGLDHRIRALPIALGAEPATMTMIVSDGDMGGSHIAQGEDKSGTAISVQMAPLKQVLEEAGIERVDALKIDVEGMEDSVLLPFFESCDKRLWPRMIIIEHTSRQQWKRDVFAWLVNAGYRETERNRSNAMFQLTDK